MAIIAESARWGDAKTSSPFTKDDWLNAMTGVRSWIDNRASTVLAQFRAQDWYPENDPPQAYVNGFPQHGGDILTTDSVSLLTPGSLLLTPLVSAGATWKYLDNGSDQGTAWRQPSFNDSSWASGPAQLGYGDGDEQTSVSGGPNANDRYRTTYFRRSFAVNDVAQFQAVKLHLLWDDGAVVYLNGQEIVRSNMPSAEINYRTLASSVVEVPGESVFHEFDIDIGFCGRETTSWQLRFIRRIRPARTSVLTCPSLAESFKQAAVASITRWTGPTHARPVVR
jgi:hypothetical protein